MTKHKGQNKPPGTKHTPLTHFLCLPLVNAGSRPLLVTSFKKFEDGVAAQDSGSTINTDDDQDSDSQPPTTMTTKIHPKAIRPLGALHCTLGVMSLDSAQLQEAIDCLQALDVSQLLKHAACSNDDGAKPMGNENGPQPPIKISLRGLESMHAVEKTSILYTAPLDRSERLLPFCLTVQEKFRSKRLLIPDNRPLKLHATIVNTIYAKGHARRPPQRVAKPAVAEAGPSDEAKVASSADSTSGVGEDTSQGHGPNAKAPLKMDATGLLQTYRDFVWAEGIVLDRISICEMGAKKKYDEEGKLIGQEYNEVASVKLPTD